MIRLCRRVRNLRGASPGTRIARWVLALVLGGGALASPVCLPAQDGPTPASQDGPAPASQDRPTPASQDDPAPASYGGPASVPAGSAPDALDGAPRTPAVKAPFRVGEVLSYSISYAFIDAGTLRMAVEGVEDMGGRRAYHLTSRAQTNATISAIYSLTDYLQSWLDVERMHSLRFVREAVEKGKKRDKRLTFDQTRHVKIFENDGQEKPISPDAQDDISIFYYLRSLPLEAGHTFTLNNLADPNDNPLRLSVLGRETVKVPAGIFDCFVLKLAVNTDSGIFSQGGEMRVWITRDARHVPVKLESKLTVGSFTASLIDEQPGTPFEPATEATDARASEAGDGLVSEAPPSGR